MKTSEEIRAVLEVAKLDRKDLLPICQEIVFDKEFSGKELKLIELDGELAECISTGSRLIIKGDGNDPTVICTNSSTYEVKEAETSNSILILGDLVFPEDAQSETASPSGKSISTVDAQDSDGTALDVDSDFGTCETKKILNVLHTYLEVKRIKPSLARIFTILEPFSYKGPEYEANIELDKIPTLESILEVPGSQREIEAYLENNLKTLNMGGKVRLIENEYLFKVLSIVLDCVDSNSWDHKSISRAEVIKEIKNLHPEFIIGKVLDWFCVPAENDECEGNLFALNEYEICRFLGQVILRSNRQFILRDFMRAWQQSVPSGLIVRLKQLQGLAVWDMDAEPNVIWYFPEESLPETPQERFAVLFESKPRWTQEDIFPFINTLGFTAQAAGALLAKYSRVHTSKNQKFYCAKHSR